jgi:hypothetical protein
MYEHLHRQLRRNVPYIRASFTKARAGAIHYRITGKAVHRMVCTGCHGDFEADPGPVLYDKVWARIAERRELLCHRCVCKRIRVHVYYHVNNVPWNTDFYDPYMIARLGSTGRCWWRGPDAFRIRNYGTYVYDEAAVVRLTARHSASLVEGD